MTLQLMPSTFTSPAQACTNVNQRAVLAEAAVVLHALQDLVHACGSDGPVDAFNTLPTPKPRLHQGQQQHRTSTAAL